MIDLKNIILTEEDLRRIVFDSIVSEKRFYSYSGPAQPSLRGDISCDAAEAMGSRLNDRKIAIEGDIEFAAGVDEATGESFAKRVVWMGPFHRSESGAQSRGESERD